MINCALCENVFTGIGVLVVILYIWKIFKYIKINYFTNFNFRERFGKSGTWAVVTGASEGIGRAIAIELAQRGMNVVVIARNKARLNELCQEISSKYPSVASRSIAFDFAAADDAAYNGLFQELATVDIGVLVNNVGINYDYARPFDTVGVEQDVRLIKVNCEAPVRMTKFVIPLMKAKRRGAIINLSSFSAHRGIPYLATYAATKSFNLTFSNSLAAEVAEFNIDILTVTPNLVISKMSQGVAERPPRKSFMTVPADEMARHTVSKLGSVLQTAGHNNHDFIESIILRLPNFIWNPLILSQMKQSYARSEKKVKKA